MKMMKQCILKALHRIMLLSSKHCQQLFCLSFSSLSHYIVGLCLSEHRQYVILSRNVQTRMLRNHNTYHTHINQ